MKEKGNYFTVDNRIFTFGLKPRDIAVYCCICRHINRKTGVAFPSRRMIAKECGIGKADTVDKSINTLIGKGLLTKRHQMRFDGGNASNMYTLSEIGDAVIRYEGC